MRVPEQLMRAMAAEAEAARNARAKVDMMMMMIMIMIMTMKIIIIAAEAMAMRAEVTAVMTMICMMILMISLVIMKAKRTWPLTSKTLIKSIQFLSKVIAAKAEHKASTICATMLIMIVYDYMIMFDDISIPGDCSRG